MDDLIDREAVLSVMEKASIGGMITDSIRAIPAITDSDYEQGFKDGLKSECLEELKPIMAKLIEGCTEAIKGITPMLIDNARLTIKTDKIRWIPCGERLPESNISVLCAMRTGEYRIMEYDEEEQAWYEGIHDYRKQAVTHWMQLPEPPEKE